VIRGKRLVVVDDSIVRGNTQRAQVRMLREAGAAEVHVRISSPPVKWPCFYGIDFATRAELVANGLGVEEIRASIGADSLGYISEDDMVAATEQDRSRLCLACFDGTYPVGLPEEEELRTEVSGRHLLERTVPALPLTDVSSQGRVPTLTPARGSRDVEGVPVGLAGGAADALSRP
jgi:amidophosphoribosyltransferase